MNPYDKPCLANGQGIICAGVPRSGTASLAKALTTLNIGAIHHGLNMWDKTEHLVWGYAGWCTFPNIRKNFKRPCWISPHDALLPWAKGDWDRLVGRYRAITDVGSMFTEQLLAHYPDAKVIVVERPVGKWISSFGDIFIDNWFFSWQNWFTNRLASWVGLYHITALQQVMLGWLDGFTQEDARKRLPEVHRNHYAMVRARVPKEQLLEFQLTDGWEPLCKFLDVPVPDEPFPHFNDKEYMLGKRDWLVKFIGGLALLKAGSIAAAVGVVVYSWRRWNGWLAARARDWLLTA